MTNPYPNVAPGIESGSVDSKPVTPSDTQNLKPWCRGISFGAAGTIRYTTYKGKVRNIPADSLAAGIIHPIRAKRIHATGTTATGIVAYW